MSVGPELARPAQGLRNPMFRHRIWGGYYIRSLLALRSCYWSTFKHILHLDWLFKVILNACWDLNKYARNANKPP